MTELYSYNLPFSSPFLTATGTFDSREGLILCFKDKLGEWSTEMAPLPGFSRESLDEVRTALIELLPQCDTFFSTPFTRDELVTYLESIPPFPSLQCGISYLGIIILAYRSGRTPVEVIAEAGASRVGVNAVAGAGQPDQLSQSAKSLAKAGFRTLKVKSPWPVHSLIEQLHRIQKKYPQFRFRLDANQSWPDGALSESSLLLDGLTLEYIEEPLKLSSPEEFVTLSKECLLPLAADETVSDPVNLFRLLSLSSHSFIILKPMLSGSLLTLSDGLRTARPNLSRVIITTSLESAVGREMCLVAAAALGDPTLDHGLNTGTLFRTDLLEQGSHNQPFLTPPDQLEVAGTAKRLKKQLLKKISGSGS